MEKEPEDYVNCLYENMAHSIFNSDENCRWKKRILISIIIYAAIEYLFYYVCTNNKTVFSGWSTYKNAAFVLGTVIFWPNIIMYSSERFYKTYIVLKPIMKNASLNDDKWYNSNAKKSFNCLINQI